MISETSPTASDSHPSAEVVVTPTSTGDGGAARNNKRSFDVGRAGQMLAGCRRAAGVRQVDLAAALCIPQPLLSMLECDYITLAPEFADEYLHALSEVVEGQAGCAEAT